MSEAGVERKEAQRKADSNVWIDNEYFGSIPIQPNDDFYIGRDEKTSYWHWPDPTISNRHLRIHCIVYEEDSTADVPPLVYAEDLSSNGTYLRRAGDVTEQDGQPYGMLMGARSGAVLLGHEDQLRMTPSLVLVYNSFHQSPAAGKQCDAVQAQEKEAFERHYQITNRRLGVGGNGSVFAALHRRSQRQLACKVVDLRKDETDVDPLGTGLRPADTNIPLQSQQYQAEKWRQHLQMRFREFDILKDLSHPNIITLEKVFYSPNTIYIFQGLVTGGDLFSYLEYKGGRLEAAEAAMVVRQILKAVEYLHDRGIVHRDLKPDNVLMTSLTAGARIVLTDFGNARHIPDVSQQPHRTDQVKRRMFTVVGTLEYAAPEIYKINRTIPSNEGYSKAVDMWSIGAITAALVTGDVIFTNRNHPLYQKEPARVILSMAAACDLSAMNANVGTWESIGERPKDFIRRLLVLDETARMTVKHALAHKWFTKKSHADQLEAIYQRVIKGWRPRRKIFNIVEPLEAGSLPEPYPAVSTSTIPSPQSISRYFRAPRSAPEHIVVLGSPRKLAHTPLPTIAEEADVPALDQNLDAGMTDSSASNRIQGAPSSQESNTSMNVKINQMELFGQEEEFSMAGDLTPDLQPCFAEEDMKHTNAEFYDDVPHSMGRMSSPSLASVDKSMPEAVRETPPPKKRRSPDDDMFECETQRDIGSLATVQDHPALIPKRLRPI
ncbi:hypothetical protein H2199_004599 [Coniosporium tulheliwenetii]|uniref:Uncharacterized protein n=1 Tax=Coniosporium tulheliwenetii TaxID=3383036 RepID=A0ACC2Z684_9PEZI|nr:hypothetical protein H2199_004599 [Cladosporium sp. JES 115]